MEYRLYPAPEWGDQTNIRYQIWAYQVENRAWDRAFYPVYESRGAALAAAEQAGLFPTAETYGVGSTTIHVAPIEFGGQPNAILTTRHHGARTSGLYREAA